MDITIIGTGNISRGITASALAGGQSVALLGHESSKAEALAGELSGAVAGQPFDVFIASYDEDAKTTVHDLVESGGLRAVDAGPLARAHELEALGYTHMAVQQGLGTGFTSTVKVLD